MTVLSIWTGVMLSPTPIRNAPPSVEGSGRKRFAAVAFDYLALFNPDSVISVVEQVSPGRGREFTNLWRSRQFEYSWLRSISNRYVDFSTVTKDALAYTARAMRVELTDSQERQLLDAYLHLAPWPDSADALRRLRDSGVRVIALTNFSPAMLETNAEHAGLTGLFEALVSTDASQTYKPDPRAYQLGVDRLGLTRDEIVFGAFAGWDAAGAKAFGYPTVWVNRFNQPFEELGLRPDRTVVDMNGLLDFVLNHTEAPRRVQ
jgi:2-haloacid dehalogenase